MFVCSYLVSFGLFLKCAQEWIILLFDNSTPLHVCVVVVVDSPGGLLSTPVDIVHPSDLE